MGHSGPIGEIAEHCTNAAWDRGEPDLSVLVSTFRRPDYLPALFDALRGQVFDRGTLEIVIADNGSGDGTWQLLVDFVHTSPFAACAVRVAHNLGPASGRNAALSMARGRHVAFTDDDCAPDPRWAAELHAKFSATTRIVQGRTEPPANQPRSRWDHTISIRDTTPFFETCNVSFVRTDVIAAGGFQPVSTTLHGRGGVPFGGEDTALGWRIVRATGTEPAFAPGAVVVHRIEPRSYREWLRVRLRRMGIFPALVRAVPELRRRMFLRYFFSARSAAFDAAVIAVSLAFALRSPWPLVGVLPYVVLGAPRSRPRGRAWIRVFPRTALGDAAAAWSLLRSSVSHRSLLL